jgi:hypothetical protein
MLAPPAGKVDYTPVPGTSPSRPSTQAIVPPSQSLVVGIVSGVSQIPDRRGQAECGG